jgi:hypothetical protein
MKQNLRIVVYINITVCCCRQEYCPHLKYYTDMLPYPVIQYLWFQLPVVYRGLKQEIANLKN